MSSTSHSRSKSSADELKEGFDVEVLSTADQFDALAYYESNAGRLVIDPA